MRSSILCSRWLMGLFAGIIITLPAMQSMAESTFVMKGSKAASLSACVVETDDIRRNHMDYMVHGRDEVVKDGDRSGKFSLSQCIDCHAAANDAGEYVPVDSEGQFCQSCHAFVAVNPACFQCHRTTPQPKGQQLGNIDQLPFTHQSLHASTVMDSQDPEIERD